VLKQKSAMFI